MKRIKYDQHKTKKNIPLEKDAVALIGEKMQAVSGTWTIEKEDDKLPLGDYQAVVKFTPDDITHYTTAEIALTGQTFIEVDTDIEDSAKVGDIIQLSADPKATNLNINSIQKIVREIKKSFKSLHLIQNVNGYWKKKELTQSMLKQKMQQEIQ